MAIQIDIHDVLKAGSVAAAIQAFADNSDEYACGVIGPAFTTSGPGPGWTVEHDCNEFAARALSDEYGATYYIDPEDGRVARMIKGDGIEWSDDSEVELICPCVEDLASYPETAADMFTAVVEYHGAESDRAAWKAAVLAAKRLAKAFDDIEAEDFN